MKRLQSKRYCTKCENKIHGFRCNYCGSLKVEVRYEEEKKDE